MASRQRIWVDRAGARIALARYGDTDSSKPPALPVHGAGFVAEVRDEVAQEATRIATRTPSNCDAASRIPVTTP